MVTTEINAGLSQDSIFASTRLFLALSFHLSVDKSVGRTVRVYLFSFLSRPAAQFISVFVTSRGLRIYAEHHRQICGGPWVPKPFGRAQYMKMMTTMVILTIPTIHLNL